MKKCNHLPRRYVTKDFLMCARCKKKIRKLKPADIEAVKMAGIFHPRQATNTNYL